MSASRRSVLKGLVAGGLSSPAVAQPVPVLRFVPQANLTSLDPVLTSATVTTNHGYYVFDTLYAVDAQMRPRPQMAQGHEVSADGRVWRIRLREGLTFHDGTPVRGIDCAASLQRWSKRDGFGQLLGAVVESWGAPDDRTVEIKLVRPFPHVIDALAKSDSVVPFIMPERLARTDPTKQVAEVVGSGPFRFVASDYVSGSRVAYERFKGYLPSEGAPAWASGAKVAHFDRVEWTIVPDPATVAAALVRGEIDWWEQPASDLLPMFKPQTVTTQVDQPAGRLAIMRLNTLVPPFDDPAVRRAVMMAVDQSDYMNAIAGSDPAAWTGCRSMFPCGTPYSDEKAGQELMRGNLAEAKATLQRSGYRGERVVIISPTDLPLIGPLGEVTADLLGRLGMKVDLQQTDWGSVVQRRNSREPAEKGGWSIFHTFGSASVWANPAVSQIVQGNGASGWYGWWRSEEADRLVQAWLGAADPASQKQAAEDLGRLALEGAATIPLGRFYLKTAFSSRLTGVLQGPAPFPWNVRRV